jgi:hypothetical protein
MARVLTAIEIKNVAAKIEAVTAHARGSATNTSLVEQVL